MTVQQAQRQLDDAIEHERKITDVRRKLESLDLTQPERVGVNDVRRCSCPPFDFESQVGKKHLETAVDYLNKLSSDTWVGCSNQAFCFAKIMAAIDDQDDSLWLL